MVLTVTLNPAVDHALFVDRLRVGDANRVQRVDKDAGGKGVNLSRVVAELGGDTWATGFLGGSAGQFVRHVLDEQRVPHGFVEVPGETRINFSIEDETKSPPTTVNLPGPTLSNDLWNQLLERCRAAASGASWAAMAGSLPPGVPPEAYAILGRLFVEAGLRVVVDADGETLRHGLACRPTFIKPNAAEASRLLGRPVDTEEQAVSAARDLLAHCSEDGFVVLSRGAHGAILADRSGTWKGESPRVEVKSTMGSGDSMIGGMLWAIEQGQSASEALAWGLAAGAATAATDGTKIARREMVLSLQPKAKVTRL